MSLFFERGRILCTLRETDGNKKTKKGCHIDQFFSGPYHAVLSSIPYVLSPPTSFTQPGTTCEPLALRRPWFSIYRLLDSTDRCKTTYLTSASAYIISQHPHISTQPRGWFYLLTQVHLEQRNLWLTARSYATVWNAIKPDQTKPGKTHSRRMETSF